MKKKLLFLLAFLLTSNIAFSQVRLSTVYSAPAINEDSLLSGLRSIRGVYYDADPFGTGQSAILATNYNKNGVVNLFVNVGNDSLELVWTSPLITENGGKDTPRYPMFGDLDGDGLVEIIYQSNKNGVFIYEWDGVAGSYNFGTQPSQTIRIFPELQGEYEYAEISDIDGDGQNELICDFNSRNGNDNDGYFIVHSNGNWSTDNPGFSSFDTEFQYLRGTAAYGLNGGTPAAMISAQLDGQGLKEILITNWNFKNVTPLRVTGPNTYEMADTTNGNLQLMDADKVALFGGFAYDIDGDGREEVYLPTYSTGHFIHMIHYETGQSTSQITPENVVEFDLNSQADSNLVAGATFGYGYGDIDGNGKPNLYFGSSYPSNVVTAEFEGGDKTDPANWKFSKLYAGDSTIYSGMTITDSAGIVDTAFKVQTAFVAKMWARNTDFDKDGFEDMILPFQAINDSIEVITKTWVDNAYAVDTTNVRNPKIWGLRILEATNPTGVEEKNVTIVTPDNYVLNQNYPNPFNPTTTITFQLPLDKRISLKIYDILGKEVKTLINDQEFKKGNNKVVWDGTDNFGSKVASGNYIYTLKYGNFTKSMKMTLLK